jgi:hypothetical protein
MVKREIIGKGKYTVSEHQQFINQEGNLVRVIKGSPNPVPVGEAYAFFNCSASKQEIERELPSIKEKSKLGGLELSLNEVKELRDNGADQELLEVINNEEIWSTYPAKYQYLMRRAKPTKISDLKYSIQARYPNHTNEETASQLGHVVNGIYTTFDKKEIFTGAIIGKANGKYCLWEED